MADPQTNDANAERIASNFARMIRQTPPEVVRQMDERLQELRSAPTASTIKRLMRKRAG